MFDGCERVANDVGENTDRIVTDTDKYYTDSYEKLCMDFHEDTFREKFDNEENEIAAKAIPSRLKTWWSHVLKKEFTLKIIEMVLLIVCAILYSQVKYLPVHFEFVKVYPNVVFMTFIIITFVRLSSITFRWQISPILVIVLNCIAAVMIGGSGGVTLHVWYYDPYVGRMSVDVQSSYVLLSETMLSLLTPFVYLADISNNINSLESLSF
ncbi:uncharacterized protein LOC143911281 [Arctopsyche grandis]|uniref:uncharacterized protein LOC143911281 n=1 Tax=Arctopsyche grandis TaxID=121162 RepID=UPI00406D9F06